MPPGALLVNVSRGGLVDTTALVGVAARRPPRRRGPRRARGGTRRCPPSCWHTLGGDHPAHRLLVGRVGRSNCAAAPPRKSSGSCAADTPLSLQPTLTATGASLMSVIRSVARPTGARLPRATHGRGRRRASTTVSSPAPRCRPARPPARTRRTSCATATTSSSTASACCPRSRTSTARSPPRCAAATCWTSVAATRCCASSTARPDLSRLGANAVLGTSLAICRASAAAAGQPLYRRIAELAGVAEPTLPMPMVNILSGGLHAGRGMDVQDFLAVPIAATSMLEAIRLAARVRDAATAVCAERGLPTLLADEGGLSPGCRTGRDALELLVGLDRTRRTRHRVWTSPSRSTSPPRRCTTPRPATTTCVAEGRRAGTAEMIEMVVLVGRRLPDRVHRGRARRGGLGRLADADRAAR